MPARLTPAHNAPESRQDGPGREEGAIPASLAIRLPVPPINNHLYRVANGRLVSTSAGKRYKDEAGWRTKDAIRVPGSWPIDPPYEVSIWFYLETRRRRDVDGSAKCLLDSVFAVLGVDDSLITDLHLFKRYDKANPRADVVISAASAPLIK